MRCPVCRCEVGNQSVCPFCGATVYAANQNWTATDYARTTIQYNQVPVQKPRESGKISDKKIRRIETKLDLLMVLTAGTFLLMLISLIVLIMK